MEGTTATEVPILPDHSGPYRQVEAFTIEERQRHEPREWTREDLARLTRLSADLRSDIAYLAILASEVDKLANEAIDVDRMRDLRRAA